MASASLILASQSPVRQRLLAAAGLRFECRPADLDESSLTNEAPDALALRLAEAKARAVAQAAPDATVIGADQTGRLDNGPMLEKCYNDASALAQLTRMAGTSHTFWSAACVVHEEEVVARIVQSVRVTFRTLSADEITAYVATGEYRGSCGSYRIEERGAHLIAGVDGVGGVHAVFGLPLFAVLGALAPLGHSPLRT